MRHIIKGLLLSIGVLVSLHLQAANNSEKTLANLWQKFPYPNEAYSYQGDALKAAWPELHGIDNEPYPSAENLKNLFERTGADQPGSPYAIVNFNGDYDALAEKMQDAWRAYHRGDFETAFNGSKDLGLAGFYLALRARAVHGLYLVEDKAQRKDFIADYLWPKYDLLKDNPIDYANAYFGVLYALGRYGQIIPIPQAIADGMPFKIRKLLDQVMEQDAHHPENLVIYGIYHCDIVAKIGGFMSRVTFGAKESTCIDYFEKALALQPEDIGIRLEYILEMIAVDREKYSTQMLRQYETIKSIQPKDAKEVLEKKLAEKIIAEFK